MKQKAACIPTGNPTGQEAECFSWEVPKAPRQCEHVPSGSGQRILQVLKKPMHGVEEMAAGS